MTHYKFCDFICRFQINMLFRETITHGISIYTPSLTTCPRRFIIISLISTFRFDRTIFRQITDYMIRCHIFPKMVFQCFVSMCYGNLPILRITCLFRCPEKHFQIHHIINNDRITPITKVPGTNQSDFRFKTCTKTFGRVNENQTVRRFRL